VVLQSNQITSSGVVLGTVTPRSRTFPHLALLGEESTPGYVLVQLAWPLMGAYGHIGLSLPARCHPSPEYKHNVDIGPAGSSCDAHCHSHLRGLARFVWGFPSPSGTQQLNTRIWLCFMITAPGRL